MVYFLGVLMVILLITQIILGIKGLRESKIIMIYLSCVAYVLLIIVAIVINYGLYK